MILSKHPKNNCFNEISQWEIFISLSGFVVVVFLLVRVKNNNMHYLGITLS